MAFYRLCSSSAFNLFIQKDVVVLKSYAKNPFINTGVFNGLYFVPSDKWKKIFKKTTSEARLLYPFVWRLKSVSTLTTFTKSLSTSHAATIFLLCSKSLGRTSFCSDHLSFCRGQKAPSFLNEKSRNPPSRRADWKTLCWSQRKRHSQIRLDPWASFSTTQSPWINHQWFSQSCYEGSSSLQLWSG